MRCVAAAFLVLVAACGGSWSPVSNTVGARNEALVLDICATDDAGTCTPARVRGFTTLSYCANVHELVVHSAPVPDAGVACQPQP
jgi:hypothetical protein